MYDIAACKSASETKVISHAVRQPVFLRSMSAPSDLEMIGNEDIEFARSSQRYTRVYSTKLPYSNVACVVKIIVNFAGIALFFFFGVWNSLLLPAVIILYSRRRRHVTSHRSSSFTLLQSLTIEDSRDKPTYSVLLGQLFAFIGTNPDQAVCHFEWAKSLYFQIQIFTKKGGVLLVSR